MLILRLIIQRALLNNIHFFCQIRNWMLFCITAGFVVLDRCPMEEGYIHFRHINGCYKPSNETGKFGVAESTCIAYGGHLIKFDDVTEKDYVQIVFSASEGLNLI